MVKKFILILIVLFIGFFSMSPIKDEETIEIDYIVQVDDTLWTVMKNCVGETVDVREYIYLTIKRNRIENAIIVPGDTIKLVVPSFVK